MLRATLISGLQELGFAPEPALLDRFERYYTLLEERNRVMNLTRIIEPREAATLHFLDSLTLLRAADFAGKRVADVGTGAGFPGLPLKLLEPSMDLTLVDSLDKRVRFLQEVCDDLQLQQVTCLHARAEELGREPGARDGFDLVVSRAVADLRMLSELCLPLVKPGGLFLAMKSVDCDGELLASERAIRTLGARVARVLDLPVPQTEVTHRVVVLEKTAPCPKAYPRRFASIKKAPL